MQFFTTLATLASCVAAITVTSPAQNAQWTTGVSQTVSWSSVNTDADSVSVYLVNFSRYPTVSTLIQANVPTSAGSITVPGSDISATGQGFQINLIAVTNPSQILAQSNQFSIVAGANTATTAAATSSSAAAAAPTTVVTSTTSQTAASNGTVPVSGGNTNSTGAGLPTSTSAADFTKLSVVGLLIAASLALF